jgi:hypothetical protein
MHGVYWYIYDKATFRIVSKKMDKLYIAQQNLDKLNEAWSGQREYDLCRTEWDRGLMCKCDPEECIAANRKRKNAN